MPAQLIVKGFPLVPNSIQALKYLQTEKLFAHTGVADIDPHFHDLPTNLRGIDPGYQMCTVLVRSAESRLE